MPALAGKRYFNYGGQGPLPDPSLQAMLSCWQELQRLGPFGQAVWPWRSAEEHQLRQALARLCGVAAERIALTENVTSGCVLPLWGLPFASGDRLLLSDAEHPGVVAACGELARRQHLEIDRFSVKNARQDSSVIENLEAALQPRTRLVVLSHLLWNTGVTMPITAVAERLQQHPQQPWLLVDAAQSVGSLELGSVPASADIFAFTGHKWCCGPEGLGGVVLSERLLSEAQPTLIGWRSLSDEGVEGSSWHSDARRFEVATSCVPLGAGLRCSLQLLDQWGDARAREQQIRRASHRLWQGLQSIPGVRTLLAEAAPASGLVSFVVEGWQPQKLVDALEERGFQLRSLADPACLRACTHVTSSDQEIDDLVDQLQYLVKSP